MQVGFKAAYLVSSIDKSKNRSIKTQKAEDVLQALFEQKHIKNFGGISYTYHDSTNNTLNSVVLTDDDAKELMAAKDRKISIIELVSVNEYKKLSGINNQTMQNAHKDCMAKHDDFTKSLERVGYLRAKMRGDKLPEGLMG